MLQEDSEDLGPPQPTGYFRKWAVNIVFETVPTKSDGVDMPARNLLTRDDIAHFRAVEQYLKTINIEEPGFGAVS